MAEKAADKDAGKGDKEDPNAKKSSVVRALFRNKSKKNN